MPDKVKASGTLADETVDRVVQTFKGDPVFVPAESDEQADTREPIQVDWTKVTIPDEVLKNQPAYKELLSESIERRQTIKELRSRIEELEAMFPVSENEEGANNTPSASSENDPVARALAQIDVLNKKIEQLLEKTASAERKAVLQAAMRDNKIPEEYGQLITGETPEQIQAQAQLLGRLFKVQSTSPGNAGSEGAKSDFYRRAEVALKGDGELTDIFAPGVHRQRGGGPV